MKALCADVDKVAAQSGGWAAPLHPPAAAGWVSASSPGVHGMNKCETTPENYSGCAGFKGRPKRLGKLRISSQN